MEGICTYCTRYRTVTRSHDMKLCCAECLPQLLYLDRLGYARCADHQGRHETAVDWSYLPRQWDHDQCDYCRA